MSFKCPNCDTVHDKVPGYVSQEKLQERINAKTEEINTLTARVKALESDAADLPAIRAERDRLTGELAALQEAGTISEAFRAQGIAEDENLRGSFRTIYNSAMAGVAEDERTSFVDWLASDAAKGHVLLKAHYGDPSAPPAPVDPNAPKPAPKAPVVNTSAGVVEPPAAATTKITPGDLGAVFESAAYKALPHEKRKALRRQWAADLAAGKEITAEALQGQMTAG